MDSIFYKGFLERTQEHVYTTVDSEGYLRSCNLTLELSLKLSDNGQLVYGPQLESFYKGLKTEYNERG